MRSTKKIFVGNLPLDTEEDQLTAWFEANGFPAESVSLSVDRLSGELRGFGFVEISERLAERCILACNGQDFLGRTLVINEAASVQERRANARSSARAGS